MQTVKHNIGAQLNLQVEKIVTIKGKKYYIVKYDTFVCRIAMLDWQYEMGIPKNLFCRLKSINDFGFPIFEQVAQQKSIPVVESINTETKNDLSDDYISPNLENVNNLDDNSKFPSKVDENVITRNIKPSTFHSYKDETFGSEHEITFYLWRKQTDDFEKWFITTGGIKRRLEILIQLAEQLNHYHRSNLVYKDIALEYITVKVDGEGGVSVNIPETAYYSVGLSNLFVYSSHCAPEIINRRMPNTPMSDCYTFAIIAHELLAFCHPFIGDIIINNQLPIEDAFKGKLPWIDSVTDKNNRLTWRRYDTFFTTQQIRNLFSRTFESGKDDPIRRPSIYEWIDALNEAINHLMYCPDCNTDYLYFKDGGCSFCDKEPFLPFAIQVKSLDKKFNLVDNSFSDQETEIYPDVLESFYINKTNKVIMSTRHLCYPSIKNKDVLSISMLETNSEGNYKLLLQPLNGMSFFAATEKMQLYSQKICSPTTISFQEKKPRILMLALQEFNIPQRILSIQLTINK